MNKTEFVGAVANELGVTKKEATPNVEGEFKVLSETLAKGEQTRFPEFEHLKFVNVQLVKGEIFKLVRKSKSLLQK